MHQERKGRSRPVPDAIKFKKFTSKLEEALLGENTDCKPNLELLKTERNDWEVSFSARDCAVEILRFLKVWFDMPQSVFFTSVSYLDQFLAKIKVQEKYLSCLCTSCFYVAATAEGFEINPDKLVGLSQSKFSTKDMQRMCDLIKIKLNVKKSSPKTFTALNFMEVFLDILECASVQLGAEYLVEQMLQKDLLSSRLAVLMGDSSCAFYRPSMLALALIQIEMERFLAHEVPNKSLYYSVEMLHLLAVIMELQRRCKINTSDFSKCHAHVSDVLKNYDSHQKSKNSQKLKWRFGSLLTCKMSFKYVYKPEPIDETEL